MFLKNYVFFFSLLIFSLSGKSQTAIAYLEEAYKKNSLLIKDDCLLDIIKSESLKNLKGENIQQIILIRHGQPLLEKNGLFTSYMAQEYSRLYDEVEVLDFDKSPICLDGEDIDTILSSNLVRAVNTAEKIIDNRDITLQSEPLFREFEREVFVIPFVQLPLNYWLVLSRLMWYAKLNTSHIEGIKTAKKRVKYAAQYLEYRTKTSKPTILVAHGMFNRALATELEKRGWSLVYSNGLGYLNVRVLARIRP